MSLIAGEINISLPNIDFLEIETFLKNSLVHHTNNITSSVEKIYHERNLRSYPWQRRVLEFKGEHIYDYTDYSEIQKILSLAYSLPIEKKDRLIILLFQSAQDNYDFDWHFDRDINYGFRICFGLNPTVPFIRFAKLKEEFEKMKDSWEKIYNHMIYEDQQYDLYPSKENTVFLINKNKHPHKVPVLENNNKRCVIIVQGIIQNLNLDFIQKIEDES